MNEDGQHGSHRLSVEELDSAATTLLASASSSLDGKDVRYADIELERWDGIIQKRRKSQDDGQESVDGDFEDVEEEEDHHLLAHETAALNQDSRAVGTLPDGAEPPPPSATTATKDAKRSAPVSWSELPKKGQLAILTLARLSEPLSMTSLQSYMFYQLKSFKTADGMTPSDSTVARQAGLIAAAFTGAQFCTAIMWGRLADWEGLGRKRVILIGLLGTAIGLLGFGFSQSFATAMFWRAVGGMLNGNTGVQRTMLSEMIKEKKFQSRAFLLLPMCFNVGVIVGPVLGGLLADPVGSYPALFGPGSTFGGEKGVWLFMKWPYALPNMVNAVFLCTSAIALVLGLDETLEALRDKPDYGRKIGKWLTRIALRRRPEQQYTTIPDHEDLELNARALSESIKKPQPKRKLPFKRIWTRNVLTTFLAHGLLAMHVGTFSNLWFVFLSTPRYSPTNNTTSLSGPAMIANSTTTTATLHLPPNYTAHLPFTFTGGLSLPPPSIGLALAILGLIGITLQLALYPPLSFRLGTITAYRVSLLLFPLSYSLAPYLSLLPPNFTMWLGITAVLAIQVLARTFALPSTAILVNNACPHPSVLGTVHGIGQSVSSATRTAGPILAGWAYGLGLEKGVVGVAWWGMAGLAVVGAVAGRWVKEGDGHEIWLPGEKEQAEAVEDSSQTVENKG